MATHTEVASAEEMAEIAFNLLQDLGYAPRHEFNKRLFLSPNNEAFFSVFQFLLPLINRRTYINLFKFCLPLDDKRREGEFRKVLCNYLQSLAKAGDLGPDAPLIKMALFTSPGRSAFLHTLLCVIDLVIRRNATALGVVVPPANETVENLSEVTAFCRQQGEEDAKMAIELRREMRTQIESLVNELELSEARVAAAKEAFSKAQHEQQVMDSDTRNLEKFSSALAQIGCLATRLQRLLNLATSDDHRSVDAKELIKQGDLSEFIRLGSHEATVNEDKVNFFADGKVDVVLYMEHLNQVFDTLRVTYNNVLDKLTSGSAIDKLLDEQRACLAKAEAALSDAREVYHEATVALSRRAICEANDNDQHAIGAEEPHLLDGSFDASGNEPRFLEIKPPTINELKELRRIAQIPDLTVEPQDQCESAECTQSDIGAFTGSTVMAPPKMPVRRRKLPVEVSLRYAEVSSHNPSFTSADISGILPLPSTPQSSTGSAAGSHFALHGSAFSGARKRRSIKEVLVTSTPVPATPAGCTGLRLGQQDSNLTNKTNIRL